MANLTLKDQELRSRRFLRYLNASGMSRAEALGKLLFFWDESRAIGLVTGKRAQIERCIDGYELSRQCIFDNLVDCGYVIEGPQGLYTIDGNQEALATRLRKCSYGKKGGQAKRAAPKAASGPAPQRPRAKPAALQPPQDAQLSVHAQACRDTWASYARAYEAKTTRPPMRNAKVNAQIKQLVQRVGAENAPGLVRFYVEQVTDPYYTKNVWPLGALLAQAEGFVTQWQTGRTFSHDQAKALGASADYYRRQQELAQRAAGLERKDVLG